MNLLYRIYSATVVRKNSYFNRLVRVIIRTLLNLFLPVGYRCIGFKAKEQANIIVSLTTFPDRISKTWLVVESILRQSKPPKKIILTLSRLQFASEELLPKKLLALKSSGLEIIWTDDDLRSHKKYYYAMKKYPQDIIVTVDDDFIYERSLLEKLLEFHAKYPGCIITNLGLKRVGVNYHHWVKLFFDFSGPSMAIMPLGGSGVLYPSGSLHSDAFDKCLIQECCPLADDIWLHAMATLNNVSVVKTDYDVYLMPLLFKNDVGLYKINVLNDKNNEQIKNLMGRYPCLSW